MGTAREPEGHVNVKETHWERSQTELARCHGSPRPTTCHRHCQEDRALTSFFSPTKFEMKVPRMPNEVMCKIMDALATRSYEVDEQAGRERDLAVCARTARVLHRSAMARLYENFDLNLHVRGGLPLWEREDGAWQALEVRQSDGSSARSFNLAMHPNLGNYMKTFNLNIDYNPPDTLDPLVVANAVANVLGFAPNVKSLSITTTYYRSWDRDMDFLTPVLDIISARCPDLRALELTFTTTLHGESTSHDVTYPLSLPFIRSFPHLQNLTLRNFHIETRDFDVSTPVPFSLRYLIFASEDRGREPSSTGSRQARINRSKASSSTAS